MANAPKVSVKFTVDSTGYTAAVNKAKAQMIDFGESSKRVHKSMITDVQATSGALRLLDGGIQNNIRSAERFLASIKGVGPALQAIYPGVGLIAVGAVLARGVTELGNFIQKARDAAQEWQASAQKMANESRLSNDELERTNVELENQIAKLTGRHENVLAQQLIDARIEADKLAISAAAAAKELKDLLKQGQPGILSQIFLGKAPTGEADANANNFQSLILKSLQDLSDARARGDNQAAQAAINQGLQYVTNARAYADTQIGQLEKAPKPPSNMKRFLSIASGLLNGDLGAFSRQPLDYTQQIEHLRVLRTQTNAEGTQIVGSQRELSDRQDLQKIQDAKNVSDKYLHAQEEAARKLKQSMDAQLDAMKMTHELSIAEEAGYWRSALAAVKGGSAPMLALRVEINKRLAELTQEQYRNLARWQIQDANGRSTGQVKVPGSLKPESSEKDVREQAALVKEQVSEMERATIAAARQKAAYDESVVALQLATGQVSKLDAAQRSAAIHAKLYADQIAAVRDTLDFYRSAPPTAENARGKADAQRQLNDLQNAASISGMEDSARIGAETPLGSWKLTLDQYVQQTRDSAAQVREIWTSSLDAVNQELVKVFSTRHNYGVRREFGNVGAGIFRNVAGTALQKAEGGVLGALGFGGKPDGTQGKPLYVKIADTLHPGSAGVANAVSTAGKGVLGGLIGKIGSLFSGLGFADGGMPPVGMASLVGEHGPELFVPKVAGTVMPSGSFGGDTHHHSWTIDARGATDPAAVNQAVMRGIAKAMPQIAAGVTRAQQGSHSRMPPSRRF